MSANWWACTYVSVKYRALGNCSEQRNHKPTTTETHALRDPGGTGMITPPFSPQYFAVGRYSLLKIFFVCVCSKKNNVTFFSPRFFISFLLWKSKVGSAKVDFLPQSMPSGAMRVLMKVLAFLGTAQLACAHWVAMEVEGWLCCRARCRNCSGPTSVSLLFHISL